MKKLSTLLTALFLGTTLWAMPSQITFQGTLKQQGVPVNGLVNMQFMFVDQNNNQIPGTGIISLPNTQVTQGLFSVPLTIPSNVNWQSYTPYIQLTVGGESLTPPQPINSNIYSLVSQTVVDGSITAVKLDSTTVGNYLVPSGMIALFTSSCPVNWTRFAALDNAFPMGSSIYGTTGGSATHTHTLSAPSDTGTGTVFSSGQGSGSFQSDWGRADHTHTVSTESNLPPYITMVFCQKQ